MANVLLTICTAKMFAKEGGSADWSVDTFQVSSYSTYVRIWCSILSSPYSWCVCCLSLLFWTVVPPNHMSVYKQPKHATQNSCLCFKGHNGGSFCATVHEAIPALCRDHTNASCLIWKKWYRHLSLGHCGWRPFQAIVGYSMSEHHGCNTDYFKEIWHHY